MTFFDIFSNLLSSHNISQKDLAESIGIRQATISDWKKNGNLPSGETAIKIADYFNISLDYLLTGKDKISTFSPGVLHAAALMEKMDDKSKLLAIRLIETQYQVLTKTD